jgi:hypothetical protein
MPVRELPVISLRAPIHILLGRAAASLGLLAGLVLGQSDPLVSKEISRLIADQDGFWAFARDGVRYSRIDPFKEPLDIRNGTAPFKGGVRGGVGRKFSALVFFDYAKSDSVTVGAVAALDQDGKAPADSVLFLRPSGQNKNVTLGVEVSALALWHDTVVIGGGYGGIALAKAKTEGQGALAGDSLIFRALPEGEDTAVSALRCPLNKTCTVSPIAEIADKAGFPDSVAALAVDSAADSVWLLIGTHTGLRRGLLNGSSFPKVALDTAKPNRAIRIERIHADARRNILWVFSGSEYFFSGDHGRTFHKPPRPPGVASAPDSLTGFNPAPEAVNHDDTTFVNFNLKQPGSPGLVVFRKDTVLANKGTGDFADIILDAADGLPLETGRLTSLAIVTKGGQTALASGSTAQGLFLRKSGGSNPGAWTSVNSLKELKGGLEEVITFPTLFSGTAPDGSQEFVNLGYRLKKDGKVTITVYNYAMEKVKALVKNAPRKGGGNRSENPAEDRWDGKDANGRHVSVGVYYIRVESDQGEKGWGKAIAVRGRGQ